MENKWCLFLISRPERASLSASQAGSSLNPVECLSHQKAQRYLCVLSVPLWDRAGSIPATSFQAAHHQPQLPLSNDLGLVQAKGLEVKGSIAHSAGKRYSAVPDVRFYSYCSSSAHIQGDKMLGRTRL